MYPNDKDVTDYSIGPFSVNKEAGTVRLDAGVYRLREPLLFGLLDGELRLGDLDWQPLGDLNTNTTIFDGAVDHSSAGEVGSVLVGVESESGGGK